ncbi:MAG: helix-turn-helix domain-containing protein [Micavibrio sp.]|nr:helix-turn-helix domain-containing protein [Micavibrio sp.]
MSRPFSHPAAADITIDGILHALSDSVRRDIIFKLMGCDKEHGMNCSESCEGLSPSSISFHHKVLRDAGLIRSEKKGVEVINVARKAEIDEYFPGLLHTIFLTHKSAAEKKGRAKKKKTT